tara:strand:+ start:341 stop:547 length:207 start_codon:yes stop_codon:yes gene_type:complete
MDPKFLQPKPIQLEIDGPCPGLDRFLDSNMYVSHTATTVTLRVDAIPDLSVRIEPWAVAELLETGRVH